MRIEHILSFRADARRPIRVLVVGAGGTGSAIVMGLPYLDQALRVWGRFAGLEVLLMDADPVSENGSQSRKIEGKLPFLPIWRGSRLLRSIR